MVRTMTRAIFYSPSEVARRAGVGVSVVRAAIASGELAVDYVGRFARVEASLCDAWVAKQIRRRGRGQTGFGGAFA